MGTQKSAKLSPTMIRSLTNLAAIGGRIEGYLDPMRKAGVHGHSIDALVRRGLVKRVERRDGIGAKDYVITEEGRATLAKETASDETPVPSYDEFVAATSGAVRASLSQPVQHVPTHRITWYAADAENGVTYELVTLVSEDVTSAYGAPYGTARVIGEDGAERTVEVNRFAARAITPLAEVESMKATTALVRSLTGKSQESAPETVEPTHVITFLDGTTEPVSVISSTFDQGEHNGVASGTVRALSVNGVERTYRFGPSGDGYTLETVEAHSERTNPATEAEISEALEILRTGSVESHKTNIRTMVAMELHKRKLAVMATAGSDTWWMLRLWEPSDSYDTPSTDEWLMNGAEIVRVLGYDEYTEDCKVRSDAPDCPDRYVSVRELMPLSVANDNAPTFFYH